MQCLMKKHTPPAAVVDRVYAHILHPSFSSPYTVGFEVWQMTAQIFQQVFSPWRSWMGFCPSESRAE